MANTFGTDIIIQSPDPERTAAFYVNQLGFEITGGTPDMIHIEGKNINMYIERGPELGPVFEIVVESVDEATERLLKAGCTVVKDEPHWPRRYVKDPHGLMYNLSRLSPSRA
jgi:hypothetical protein